MEGCGYRDHYNEFQQLGVEIVGASFDSPSENEAWAEEEGFQYELWTDEDKTLALYYGAITSSGASSPSRVTKILDANGTLVLEYEVTNFGTHPAQVLEDCKKLFGSE